MHAAIENARKFMRAPWRVWGHSVLLSFIGTAIAVDFVETLAGVSDSPVPVALLTIAGALSLVRVFHESPRDWSSFCHFLTHWKRRSDCRREQRERVRARRQQLEREVEEREQTLRVRRAKYIEQMKRDARELRNEEGGGQDGL